VLVSTSIQCLPCSVRDWPPAKLKMSFAFANRSAVSWLVRVDSIPVCASWWRESRSIASEIRCELGSLSCGNATPARAQREGHRVCGQAPLQRRFPATPLCFFLPVNTHPRPIQFVRIVSQHFQDCQILFFPSASGFVPTRPKNAARPRVRQSMVLGRPAFRDQPLASASPPILCCRIFAPWLAILTCCPVRAPGNHHH